MSESKQLEVIRNELGQVVKGSRGINPTGENGYTKLKAIIQAIKYEGKVHGTGLEKHIAKRFYINDAVLMAVLKKIVPDAGTNDGITKEINIGEMKILLITPKERTDGNRIKALSV